MQRGGDPPVCSHVCVAMVGPPLTPAVLAVPCGTLNFTNVDTADCGTSYADGAFCATRCNDGYTGSPVATCSAAGSWHTWGNCTAGVQPLPSHVPFSGLYRTLRHTSQHCAPQ